MATTKLRKKQEATPSRLKFAKALVKRRKERGYATAYAFFHKNGGKPHFGFSYLHYLFIERGLRLPGREGLRSVLETLGRQSVYGDERRELLELYLRALIDGDALFEPVFDRPTNKSEAKSDDVDENMLRMVSSRQVSSVPRMSQDQVEVLLKSPQHFWMLQRLLQTGQRKPLSFLSEELGFSESELRAAGEDLVRAKLLEKTKGGGFSSPHFETDLFEPLRSLGADKMFWIADTIAERVKRVGEKHYYNYFILPIEEQEQINVIIRMLRQLMSRVYMFRSRTPVPHGRMVAIETRVSNVFKFD